MEKHTQGKWYSTERVEEIEQHECYMVILPTSTIDCEIAPARAYGATQTIALANARRIVACVNACEGIPTEALELIEKIPPEDLSKTVIAQNAELLDALILALPYVESAADDPCYKKGAVAKVVNQLRAAIQKATI